jgi:dinuclear metal center YbgI/SA1388 family protein
MPALSDLTAYLADYLSLKTVADYPQAHNGLQLENRGQVARIAAAVDACEAVLVEAAERKADFLLVHHGLYWGSVPVVGGMYRKVRCALQHDMAVYSAHLPLDVHPEVGNNVLLARALGLERLEPFLALKGQAAGLAGHWGNGGRCALVRRLEEVVGGRVHVCAGGPEQVRRVGVVTGGAGSEVAKAAAEGVDTFITGEGPHWSFTLAEELGVNLLYGGHYATETFGVKALAEHLSRRFGVPWEFIDHPTGL